MPAKQNNNQIITALYASVEGHIKIYDSETSEVLLDTHNDIHSFNFSRILVNALSNKTSSSLYIKSLKFGNGGAFIDNNGDLNLSPPNITSTNATLYNTTWIEYFDGTNPLNDITASSNINDVSSYLNVKVVLGPNRPSGQSINDNNSKSQYIQVNNSLSTSQMPFTFSEIGLFDSDDNLLTHLIFSPIEKTQNRTLIIEYAINILVN